VCELTSNPGGERKMINNSINIIHIQGKAKQAFQEIANLCKWNDGKTTLGELAKQQTGFRPATFKDDNYWGRN